MTSWRFAQGIASSIGFRHLSIIPLSSLEAAKGFDKRSITEAAYAGCPLAQITPQLRGRVLETVARRAFEICFPNALIRDPVPGDRCNGSRRGLHSSEYDWLCDGRRVQCKSGQMCWNKSRPGWTVRFSSIKLSSFDELVLVLYSPFGLHLFTHSCKTGLSTTGVSTAHAGLNIDVCSRRNLLNWAEAEDVVLKKLQQFGRCITTLKTFDVLVLAALQQHTEKASLKLQREAYAQHPFNSLTPSARALLYERVVQEVDMFGHPGSKLASTAYNSPCDWNRDGLRVECKHSRLIWRGDGWLFRAHNVAFRKFDVLYLALDSPLALHIFRFAGSKYVCSNGLAEGARGKAILVLGPAKETRVSVAVEVIMTKLVSSGSKHVASVTW